MSKNTGTGARINGKRQCIRPHILRGLFMKIKCILNSENVVLAAFDNKEKNRAKYAQKLSGRKKDKI